MAKNVNNGADTSHAADSTKDVYELDLRKPSVVQPIEARDLADGAKFVQVEVVKVVNPGKYALSFKVHYQSGNNEKIYLGSFSLYPADNPGTFIVATQGKLKNEGAIVLSLEAPDKTLATDEVKVTLKRVRFFRS